MSDYSKIIATLSPAKRALLELKLKKQGSNYNSFPLSFSQQRLWFIDQLEPGNPIYNIPSAFRLEGSLDIAALQQAINEVVRRHEILRTSFNSLNGQPLQVVAPGLKINLPLTDLQGLAQSEQEQQVQLLSTEEAKLPFDLTRAPLLRAKLIKLAEQDFVVLLTMHHIISDGWSIGILMREIAVLYDAISRGKPSPLLPLKLQYADYAKWQRQHLQGEVLDKQLAYWKEKLGMNPPLLELSTDFPRPARMSFAGSSLPVELPKQLVTELHHLSRQEGVTLFMVLLAGFQTLLHRYTGQDEISIGSPIANRTRSETENLIGFFVNTLVLHTDLSGDPNFRELLARVKEMTLGAYANQDVPFEKLVEVLQPERDMSHTPLFQVLFVLQNTPVKTMKLPNLTLSPVLFDRGVAQFDLSINLGESEAGLKGGVEFNTELFKPATIQRMMDHFKILLESAVANPDQQISSLPMLQSIEREHILVDWNKTENDYPKDFCIHQLFETQVAQNPDAIAVVYESKQITYQELNRRANQVAHYLRKCGVKPDDLVGLCVDRSVEMIVGLMGILKSGAAYVPLDPSYPEERLAYILDDSQVSVLLTLARLAVPIPEDGRVIVRLDSEWATIARENPENPENPENFSLPENLAYLIYTSGSTGRPKGVMLQHRSAVNLWSGLKQTIYSRYPDRQYRVSLNAPLLFDASVQELVMLLSGYALCIIPQEVRLDGEGMLNYIRDQKIDVLDCVPSQMKLLISAGMLDETGWSPSIILPGGEAIDQATWQVLQNTSKTDAYNMYGPTECAVDSTICVAKEGPDRPAIGRPINNATHYILDKHLKPVPVGVPGELYIGGDGLARGYHNRPQLTADKFVPNPYGNEPGSRLYRTGDLVRYLPDGNIEFLGRIDHQVKVRGFRIELGEIEATLKQHVDIKEAVVVVREDIPGNKLLVAYLVASNEHLPGMADVRAFLKGKLPEYMVPSVFMFLEHLPLTPNGKINRRALPAPDWSQRDLQDQYLAPRTPVEEMLATVYSKILKVDRVSATDNFFDLGGHSLLATQVISRIREVLSVELPLRDLFEAPVLADLALRIEQAQRQSKNLSAPPIVPMARDKELPLSFAQQRLWFLDQLDPESPLYNIPMGFRLKGKLDIEALQQSINAIVQRHENLRSTFQTADGKARIEIAASLTIPLPLIDLQDLPANDREQSALKLATEEIKRPFRLNESPLLRTVLYRLNEANHIIVLTMHHIISDGWSSGVLIQEMAALYDGFSKGKPSPLPDLKIQYSDFAHWQRNWLQGEVLEKQLDYWKKQLADSPSMLEFQTDFPRPAVQTSNGDYVNFELTKELSDQLVKLSRQENVTLFMTLLAAFQTLLSRYSGQEDICVGTPIANRTHAEIEPLIGFFVNTLVLRSDLSGNPRFRDLLDRVKGITLEAYTHQDIPFEKLVDVIQPQRDLSHPPLFQVMFTLQQSQQTYLGLPGLTLNPIEIHSGISKFDLTLFMAQGESLSGAFEYNTDLFKAETINRMVRHFQVILDTIVQNPSQRILDLPLLDPDERRNILYERNDTAVELPSNKLVHQLFEDQVRATPNAIAVDYLTQYLSFDELNRRSNQLAHYLIKQGVSPETLVGICMERSPEMMIALFAVLKAGGAYVPIDPSSPADRLTYLITDSQLAMLLTQQKLLNIFPHNGIQAICLDNEWKLFDQENDENPTIKVLPENLAYAIYTSGSTGKPKGTLLTHEGLINYLFWCIDQYPLTEGNGSLVHSSLAFDATITGLYAPLLAGKTVTLVPETQDIETVATTLKVNEISFGLIKITPAHLQLLGQQLSPDQAKARTKAFIIGGENLTTEHTAFWQKYAPDTLLINEYGPTETVVGCMNFQVAATSKQPGSIPIGRPIHNTQIYVLDRRLNPVPVGIPGEIYIGGAGVARGYLNRPDLTAGAFIPHPYSDQPGTRLYKTGDLARLLPDGNIEFLGRTDDQVKIRGFRIELSEIEIVLSQHPQLREVAVIIREDNGGEKRLVAYCVPAAEPSPTISALRSFLQTRLPEYMIPATFVMLKQLPLTTNGKVDRKSLPAPDQSRPELDHDYVAPVSEVEKQLAKIWSQVLNIETIGVHDNFFELGGDSILSIQVISRANQQGLRLTPKHIFQSPTIAGLARLLATLPSEEQLQIEQGLVTGDVPLTPIQAWFFEQDLPDPHHWNQAVLIDLKQTIQPDVIQKAMKYLVNQHDSLRLRFDKSNNVGWRQYYGEDTSNNLFIHVDLSSVPELEQEQLIESVAYSVQSSLNINQGPLLRTIYFDVGGHKFNKLLLVIHHLAVDGVSWRILLEDLHVICQQISDGKNIQLPPKTTSFKYWSNQLTRYAQSQNLLQESSYWLKTLNQYCLALPKDFPEGINSEASIRSLLFTLNEDETKNLIQRVPSLYHTRIDEVLITALARSIYKLSGSRRSIIDLEGHGREDIFKDVDLSRTVGWFTTIYPVVIDLTEVETTAEAILSVKEQLRRTPNHGIGFGLLRYLRPEQQIVDQFKVLPRSEILFNYLGQFDQVSPIFQPANESAGATRNPHGLRSHLIEINGGVNDNQLGFEWIFSENIFAESTIKRWADEFLDQLRSIIAHCQSTEAGGYTPSDFKMAKLDQTKLNKILKQVKQNA